MTAAPVGEPGFPECRCSYCSAPIVWYRTVAGEKIPVEPEQKPDGRLVLVDYLGCLASAGEWPHPDDARVRVLKWDEPDLGAVARFVCHLDVCPGATLARREAARRRIEEQQSPGLRAGRERDRAKRRRLTM